MALSDAEIQLLSKIKQRRLFFHYQGLFECSLQELNSTIHVELEQFNQVVQNCYPSYFETFRTDGMEYDLYVGQSITRNKVFDPQILKFFREEQIKSMVKIARKTLTLLDHLSMPLRTTQLIFIHATSIDISFRLDEKHFDVEGGYNIRYQVLKKRIDKALVKATKERLVQPHKIAVVYSSSKIEKEIVAVFEDLLQNNWLEGTIEFLELEPMQGVLDLKALRVTIKYEN